jgi:hypothetical protein
MVRGDDTWNPGSRRNDNLALRVLGGDVRIPAMARCVADLAQFCLDDAFTRQGHPAPASHKRSRHPICCGDDVGSVQDIRRKYMTKTPFTSTLFAPLPIF